MFNTAFLRAKMPYFITLLLIGICANYLFHGFFMRDIIMWIGIGICAVLKPDIFCLLGKNDEYNVISALPFYLMVSVISVLGLMMANRMGHSSVDLITGISITILTVLVFVVIDKSRYT